MRYKEADILPDADHTEGKENMALTKRLKNWQQSVMLLTSWCSGIKQSILCSQVAVTTEMCNCSTGS